MSQHASTAPTARPRSFGRPQVRVHLLALMVCLLAWQVNGGCGGPNNQVAGVETEDSSQDSVSTPDKLRSPLVVTRFSMGVRFQMALMGAPDPALKRAAKAAFDELDRLEAIFNNWSQDSAISRFNQSEKLEWQPVQKELASIVHLALQFQAPCRGAFDITLLPALRAWGFLEQEGRRPSAAELSALRSHTGMELVEVRLDPPALRCKSQATELDLGAVAKGYGMDRAVEVLRANGIDNAFLTAGGSTAFGLGPGPMDLGWPMELGPNAALEHPTSEDTMRIWLRDEACATSGQGINNLVVDGEVVGHILDPRSLTPMDSDLDSVTCVMPSAAEADIWATALVVLGPDQLEQVMGTDAQSAQDGRWAVMFLRDGSLSMAGQGPRGSDRLKSSMPK